MVHVCVIAPAIRKRQVVSIDQIQVDAVCGTLRATMDINRFLKRPCSVSPPKDANTSKSKEQCFTFVLRLVWFALGHRRRFGLKCARDRYSPIKPKSDDK